ncbi:MAG: hypothetical protein IPO30_12005 [Hyphomonadaceae bacterium]|mgnify:CR=1 FL=1|nr:hypothetical protein [Hyphomonadaceae bacterium]
MRVLVAVVVALSLGACGGADTPALEAAAKLVEPVELGQTVSSIDCPLEKAAYTEPQAGWELRFRAGKPWEMHGMTESVFDLVSPKGEVLWGEIASNMGTSRDVGAVFYRCAKPGPNDADLSEAQLVECRVWDNLVYSLNGGEPGFMPTGEGNAPERILVTDLGRKIRYSVAEGPGDEPWDVFTFKACAG